MTSPSERFVREWQERGRPPIAFDIETPGKGDTEDEAIASGEQTGIIYRIGLAYVWEGETYAGSFNWNLETQRWVMVVFEEAEVPVVCNRHFDVPRLAAHGCILMHPAQDIQDMWHILHSDLPKRLGFIAPFLVPEQSEWKSLSHDKPAFYNATDAAVTIEGWHALERLLRAAGLYDIWREDVLGLNPLLEQMSAAGMPMSDAARLEVARELKAEQDRVLAEIRALIPPAALEQKVWKRKPKVEAEEQVCLTYQRICPKCHKTRINKKHPCWAKEGIEPKMTEEPTMIWVTQKPFVVSPKRVLAYLKVKGYRVPQRDGKATTDEASLLRLALKHETDKVFPLILQFRGLQKELGTYVGYPDGDRISGGLRAIEGLVHTTFKHQPSTLRLSSDGPNMQNIPR